LRGTLIGFRTSATAAIMLVAFQRYNLTLGPLLFESSSELVWALIASLYIGNVMLLVLNLPLIRIWVKVLSIPKPMLYAGILVFATLGIYSVNNSFVDLMIMYAIGVLGFFMRRLDIPVAPMVLGVILGQLMEVQFRRAMAANQGDLTVFVTRPFSLTLLLFAVAAILLPNMPGFYARLRGRKGEGRAVFGSGDED
jgi:putative tricarboxylic transport membrane protein